MLVCCYYSCAGVCQERKSASQEPEEGKYKLPENQGPTYHPCRRCVASQVGSAKRLATKRKQL